MVNSLFTNGMIAVKEKSLFGEKLLRFAEMSAEEVLRALHESGFGGSETDEEGMLLFEESALDAFIREFAPSAAERAYLLSPRDFHNAKAFVKAQKLGTGAEKFLAPVGEVEAERLEAAAKEGNFEGLGLLGETMKEALEGEELTGAEIGAMFDKALFLHLKKACARSPILRRLLRGKADRTNLLTAMRAEEPAYAEALFVEGGKLKREELLSVFDGASGEKTFEKSEYREFYGLLRAAKEKGAPFTEAERALGSFEAKYFYRNRYELEGKEPFLYYVFRRRAEIGDVRMILVCLHAGLKEQDVKRRLRSV